MSQLALFEAREMVLVDDDRGRIVYTPGFVPRDVADDWFFSLRSVVDWQSQRRLMYDREVDVPRLTAHFDLDPPEAERPPAIGEAARRVREALGVGYNSVGLNRYRNGDDSVAPHNDHLDMLIKGEPIALVSLGATRRMAIRAKRRPARSLNVELEAGSLLVMSYATQLHYTHGIPKTEELVGERISLAFRVQVEGEVPAEAYRRRQYR